MFEDDAGPTILGDFFIATSLFVLFVASIGLGWYVFCAVRDLVLL